jgi:hypothetical protein
MPPFWWRKKKLQEFSDTGLDVLIELARSRELLNPSELSERTGRPVMFVKGVLQSFYDSGHVISDRRVTAWTLHDKDIPFTITASGRKRLKDIQDEQRLFQASWPEGV